MKIICPNCHSVKEIKDGTDKVDYKFCSECIKNQYGEGDK